MPYFCAVIMLSRHIESLLLKHDCVIVPGLGGFVTQYVSARRVEGEQLFLPPYRSVGFNPQLTLNDGLLVQSYMQAYNASYSETIKLIADAVRQLKERLQEKGEFELPGIGTLSLGMGGHYNFSPCEAGVLSPELYGLDSLSLERRAGAVAFRPAAGNGKKAKKHRLHLRRTERDYTLSVNREVVNYVAAAIVAVVFYFVWATPVNVSEAPAPQTASMAYESLFASPAAETGEAVSRPAASARKVQMEAKENKGVSASAPVTAVKETIAEAATAKPEKERTGDFTIVLASSITSGNASAYVRQLQKEGYGEASVYKHRRMVRVVYGSYPTEDAARTVLHQLRKKAAFGDAWVMARR